VNDPLVVLHRAISVHRALTAAGIGNALGGALALAYHVGEARATQDIDLNVFLPRDRAEEALRVLPDDVPWDSTHLETIAKDGQVRIMWPVETGPPVPLDLFFAEHELHQAAGQRAVWVEMLDTDVPILTATDLTVFKALFDRSKDWVDIESMVEESPPSLDLDEVLSWMSQIVGPDDSRLDRLRELAAR
jgi:Nucleotidyl transferase AbiEii toxin, Type IV TA system